MLMGLPLLEVVLTGQPLTQYFEFPPRTQYVSHASFSWSVFILLSVFIILLVSPLIHYIFARFFLTPPMVGGVIPNTAEITLFPWWGWLGLLLGVISWILAWNRFPWFAVFQAHTFIPLWVAYILIINALTYQRRGHCMITDQPKFFLFLFPVSAVFWWFFEYLNRFVQNWHYVGNENFTAWEYFWFATFSYSTVLPAVLGTREWLAAFGFLKTDLAQSRQVRKEEISNSASSRLCAMMIFILSILGLACIGIWPNLLFPLVWISPLLIIVSLQIIFGGKHIFFETAKGDWHLVATSGLAALICGFFWEMWNYHSFAKWIYTIPYVNRFHIFEMPILGYAGYIPFGLLCTAIGDILREDKP